MLASGLDHAPTQPLELPIIPPHLRSSGEHNPKLLGSSLSSHRLELEKDNGRARGEDVQMSSQGLSSQAAPQQRVQGLTWKAVAIAGSLITDCKFTVSASTYYIICRAQGPFFKII